ncbi:MAG: hypothetical protein AAFV87_10340 [Pseudomonadota bacterium]
MFEQNDPIVLFRMAERLTLTGVVLLVAAIVMVGFWRAVQKFDLTKAAGVGISGSFVFSTPVFVLLTIVGYAYVSLSHPITVGADQSVLRDDVELAEAAAEPAFIGSAPVPMSAAEREARQQEVIQQIRSLNCLATKDETENPIMRNDLAGVKLALIAPLWQPEFGDFGEFELWARGLSRVQPDQSVREAYEAMLEPC